MIIRKEFMSMNSTPTIWQEFADSFISVLELQGFPVAITYTDEEIEPTVRKGMSVCKAILMARDGEIILMNKAKCTCPGGKLHCGLGKGMPGMEKFLVEGEKLWATVAIARMSFEESHRIAPPPLGLAKNIVFSPLNKAPLRPDIVIILCNAWQASRLIYLAIYHGESIKPNVSGSLCWGAITYPLMTGNFNVTMGDTTARRQYAYDPNDLIVSIPYRMIPQMIEAMEYSTAGRGKSEPWFNRAAEGME